MATSAGHDHVAPLSRVALLACEYAYDATGLLARIAVPGQTGERFWRGTCAANELRTSASGSTQLTWLRAAGQPIIQQVTGAVTRTTLLATAISGSVLLEADTAVRAVTYAPHGSRPDGEQAVGAAEAEPAFNGELLDAASGCYLLGAGHHRPYSPRLGIFLAADGLSPFGAGGLNPYAYCAGDPVNRSDPTGHFWKWIVAAVGLAVGVAAVAVTFGAASKAVAAVATVGISALTKSAAGAIASTTLGMAAVGAEVGAIAAQLSGDTKTATILGVVGLALGIVAAVPAIAKAATRGAAKFSRFSQRLGSVRTQRASANVVRGARPAARSGQGMMPPPYSPQTVRRMPSSMDGFIPNRFGPRGGHVSAVNPNVRFGATPGPAHLGRPAWGASPQPRFSRPTTPPASNPPRRVRFAAEVEVHEVDRIVYPDEFIRETSRIPAADPADVALLMRSRDPADDYIRVALSMTLDGKPL
ncbi:RHS repeat-associated core domain-containing protein [Stenotrophomonas sp. PS02289]|uniref:RHS repeat-associated core domain-containing protein n=1 Tax=Stenotrophomonas sp. PS02289 TaxID=2991422 RepID=UPI00249CAE0C|nr:RHS repeat-associated core domain-containing protein [Stenotrophomonas sp. PS02289]